MGEEKKLPTNNIITLAGIVVIVAAIVAVAVTFQANDGTNSPYSPNILDLTQPVNSIRGTIKSISGNTFNVSSMLNDKTVSFTVTIDQNTQTVKPAAGRTIFGFLSKEKMEEASSKEIHAGDDVTINSKSDIRLAKTNRIIASSIMLPATNREVAGIVTDVQGNQVTLDAYPEGGIVGSINSEPVKKTYTISLRDETEYYERSFENLGKNTKVDAYSLKPQEQIAILLTSDLHSGKPLEAQALLKILAPKPTPAVVR